MSVKSSFYENSSIYNLINGAGSAYVVSYNGREGVVVPVAGDYTASQITNVPAGNIAAVTVQAALAELDAEKVSVTALDDNEQRANAARALAAQAHRGLKRLPQVLQLQLQNGSSALVLASTVGRELRRGVIARLDQAAQTSDNAILSVAQSGRREVKRLAQQMALFQNTANAAVTMAANARRQDFLNMRSHQIALMAQVFN